MHEHFIQMYDWKWICVQHPMLLMSDDKSEPRAAEVMPPWGAGSMEGFLFRFMGCESGKARLH